MTQAKAERERETGYNSTKKNESVVVRRKRQSIFKTLKLEEIKNILCFILGA